MSKRTYISISLAIGILALPLFTAAIAPANAVGTAFTLTISGGALSINAPETADLGVVLANTAGTSISTKIGWIVVTDNRGAVAGSGWIATAISTALTPPAGPALAASLIAYTVGTVTETGTVTCTNNDPTNLTGVSPVVTATDITGSNTARWNPTLTVTIPGTYVVGTYVGSITHSVL